MAQCLKITLKKRSLKIKTSGQKVFLLEILKRSTACSLFQHNVGTLFGNEEDTPFYL